MSRFSVMGVQQVACAGNSFSRDLIQSYYSTALKETILDLQSYVHRWGGLGSLWIRLYYIVFYVWQNPEKYHHINIKLSCNQALHCLIVLLYILSTYSYISQVIQCYIKWSNQSLPVPRIQLVYFNRVNIPSGTQIEHIFDVAWENWAYWNNGHWSVQTG